MGREPPKEEQEEGAPAWMLTYGDMVTLILTFFVLLVSIMVIDPKKFVEVLGTYEKMTGEGDNRITRDDPQKTEDYFMQIIKVAARRSEVLEGGDDVTKEGEAVRVFAFEENYIKTMAEAPFFAHLSLRLTETAKINLNQLAEKIKERAGGHVIKIIGHYARDEEDFGSLRSHYETQYGEAHPLVRDFEQVRIGAEQGDSLEDALEVVAKFITTPRELAGLRAAAVRQYLIYRGVLPSQLVTMTGGAITSDRVYRAKGADAVTFRKRGEQLVADLDAEGKIATEKVDILKGTAEASGSGALNRMLVDGQILRPWQQFIFVDSGGGEGRMVEIVVTGQLVR